LERLKWKCVSKINYKIEIEKNKISNLKEYLFFMQFCLPDNRKRIGDSLYFI